MEAQETGVITSLEDLVEYYHKVPTKDGVYVGIEWERSGVYRNDFRSVAYEDDHGYLAILKKLVAEVGWNIIDGHRNQIYELERGNAKVSIEADGRLELAGSPQQNLHDLAREFKIHAHEVKEISNFFNVGWLSLGWQPLHKIEEMKIMEKRRYEIFKEKGDRKWMENYMKKTNGITVNFSFSGEENAIRKAQTAFKTLPIVAAMFSSSSIHEGEKAPHLEMRRQAIREAAGDRNMMPPTILDKDFSYKKWIEHFLELPVFLIRRQGKPELEPKNFTFAEWIEKGEYEGIRPTFYHFDQHIKTCWMDIRLRPGYLEYRAADSVPFRFAMSVPALVKGLTLDSASWEAVDELLRDCSYEEINDMETAAIENGLQAEFRGKKLLDYARELLAISSEALNKFNRTSAGGDENENVFLTSIREQILVKEKSIGREILELWEGSWNKDPGRLLEWCDDDI